MKSLLSRINLFLVLMGSLNPVFGGNERSGGMPPPPIIIVTPFSNKCEVELTQLTPTLKRPVLSRASIELNWAKGDQGKYVALNEIKNWKHSTLGTTRPPIFHSFEVPLMELPKEATLDGKLILRLGHHKEDMYQTTGYRITLTANLFAASGVEGQFVQSESSDVDSLSQHQRLSTEALLYRQFQNGAVLNQRRLKIVCVKIN